MDTKNCKHLRIRPNTGYGIDLEKFIQTLERQYKLDFRSLSEWRNIIKIMSVRQANYKNKLRDAAKREHDIIENLNIEYSRLSPFQLTDRLTRTAKLWELIKSKPKMQKVTLKDIELIEQELFNIHEYSVEESEVKSTAHPNTEEIQSKEMLESKTEDTELKSISSHHLPVSIITNQHRFISSLGSEDSGLHSERSYQFENPIKSLSAENNIETMNQRKLIQFHPNELNINGNTYKEQSVKLIITNCSLEYVYIRFNGILDTSYFKTFCIVPATAIKLYAGLSFTLKFTLKLKNHKEATSLKTEAKFKVGRNVYSESKDDILSVPIIGKVPENGPVKVTGIIYIPPVYKWHVTSKCGYPRGVGQVYVDGDKMYHLHIRKKNIDFVSPENSIESTEVVSPETDSLILKNEEVYIEVQNDVKPLSRKTSHIINEEPLIQTSEIVTFLLEDLLNLALEPFVFKQTYLRLFPKNQRILQVYFTKPDHIGFHHTCYDLEFCNFDTNEIVMKRTIKVFAEVLPHPITINPPILDMTSSPIILGYCKSYFTITNTHKIYPVTVKIKTTTKMQKMFNISPMETLIPTTSSVNFEIRMCLKQNNAENNLDELSYFTIKIIVCGHKTIYSNSPPLFYEIIAPCAEEFKQIYGRKYFSESPEISQDNDVKQQHNILNIININRIS